MPNPVSWQTKRIGAEVLIHDSGHCIQVTFVVVQLVTRHQVTHTTLAIKKAGLGHVLCPTKGSPTGPV